MMTEVSSLELVIDTESSDKVKSNRLFFDPIGVDKGF